MDGRLKEIKERVKYLREIKGFSLDEMASFAGVSTKAYEEFEKGEADFSFTFIYNCAKAFGVEINDLLSGESPRLSLYNLVKKGEGKEIERKAGFIYHHLAPYFKDKGAEPFHVLIPYKEAEPSYSSHEGQEMDIVIKGRLSIRIGDKEEILEAGDSIYYDSGAPHALMALDGEPCEIYAFVLKGEASDKKRELKGKAEIKTIRENDFIETKVDSNGVLKSIRFIDEDKFNFAFDCVDKIADTEPNRRAMLWVSNNKEEKTFTFADMKKYSNKTANYFLSLGIKKGDRVLVVLKRHYQFWFTMLALHKIGAIAIPATNQLVEHDFEYRYKAAGVTAVIITADGEVKDHAERAANDNMVKILVGGKKEGWFDFNEEMEKCSDVFERCADSPCGDDTMLMIFTSGTTGYPRIAAHSYKYALGHYITAKYWHNVEPDGLHFTISDTGWGKALWGKIYGQWLARAGVFTYDFDKFSSEDILPLFAKHGITTFCAPPTMYRFFIKEDLSKYDLRSLTYATTAGEALNPEVSLQFKKATGLTIMEAFGQTETTLAIGNLVGTTPKEGSMGLASPLYEVHLLDAEGNDCKVGETGEISIRADKGSAPAGLFKGYYLDDEKTNAVWHDGFYHTGDQATMDEEGYFYYVGRIDDVIKSSGYRIGPFEIESVIMELPYVLECAITAVPDEVRGQIVKATIVLVKGKEGDDALKKEIQEYVKKRTAPYKYPRIVEFVTELPKTISGKIRRVEIRENDKNK